MQIKSIVRRRVVGVKVYDTRNQCLFSFRLYSVAACCSWVCMYPWRHLCKGCSINTDRTDGTQDSCCILRACARQTQDRYPSLRRMCTRPLQAAFVFLPKSFPGKFKRMSNVEFKHHHHGIRHWTQYHIPPNYSILDRGMTPSPTSRWFLPCVFNLTTATLASSCRNTSIMSPLG